MSSSSNPALASSVPERLAFSYIEAAERLGLSSRTIWQLVRDGELKAFRVGRAVRISLVELQRFIEARSGSEVAP